MAPLPDLSTEEGRAEYRKELRRVGLPYRLGGLALIVLAAFVVVSASRGWLGLPEGSVVIGYGMLALGWALVIAAVFMRTRHHKRRLAEGL
jgi:hypothetical protein